MKTFVAWAALLWLSLVLENTRTDLFPACSLTIPLAVGCILWMRTGWSIQLAGFALIGRWLLQPSVIPIEIAVVIVSCAWMVTKGQQNQWSVSPTKAENATRWIWPLVVITSGMVSHTAIATTFDAAQIADACVSKFTIAIPVMLVVLAFTKAADEFGIRRTTTA